MATIENILNENWNAEDDKTKNELDKLFVSCDERKTSEKDKFDEYEKKYGKERVDYCCKRIKPTRKRKDFEKCLKG